MIKSSQERSYRNNTTQNSQENKTFISNGLGPVFENTRQTVSVTPTSPTKSNSNAMAGVDPVSDYGEFAH